MYITYLIIEGQNDLSPGSLVAFLGVLSALLVSRGVSFGVTLWMYATPVVYPLSTLSDGWIKNIILLNPVTAPVELFRFALVGKGSIEPLYLAGSCGFALLVLFGGIMIFNKVERTFMDTV